MQRLQGQHRRHPGGRQRRPAKARRGEQVRVITVGEHLGPVRGQEREHAARRDQVPGQHLGVQKLPAHPLESLHENNYPRPSNTKPANTPAPEVFFSRLLEHGTFLRLEQERLPSPFILDQLCRAMEGNAPACLHPARKREPPPPV
jgi:hypothetical protein